MNFTRFTLTQGGHAIGDFTVMELAISAAKQHAADTGKSVTVVAHVAGGGSKATVFNPDGTNDKIWNIDKGRPLVPAFGRVYLNRGGGKYRCIDPAPTTGTTYYNASGGFSNTMARFQNIESGWTFTAKGIIQYVDGTIEWDHSSDGHWEEVIECPA